MTLPECQDPPASMEEEEAGPEEIPLDCEPQGMVEEGGECVMPEPELDCESQGMVEEGDQCVMPESEEPEEEEIPQEEFVEPQQEFVISEDLSNKPMTRLSLIAMLAIPLLFGTAFASLDEEDMAIIEEDNTEGMDMDMELSAEDEALIDEELATDEELMADEELMVHEDLAADTEEDFSELPESEGDNFKKYQPEMKTYHLLQKVEQGLMMHVLCHSHKPNATIICLVATLEDIVLLYH